jgi:hypothetical protein
VAFVVDQLRVVVPFTATEPGLAVIVTVGGGCALQVTLTFVTFAPLIVPPALATAHD